jgi:DNA-binding response OmpR family regulator
MTAKILIIEDDANLAAGLEYNLVQAGYNAARADNGPDGLKQALADPPDLIILDLMLPGLSGMEVLTALRGSGSTVPVIILSAIDDETEKVRGFDLGAVDYVTKPFGVAELLARIRTRLKQDPGEDRDRIELAHGTIRLKLFTFETGEESVGLTPSEIDILKELNRRAPEPVSRRDLIRAIWGHGGYSTRTLDTHVARLRKKIEADPAQPRNLVTVHGVGYRLVL